MLRHNEKRCLAKLTFLMQVQETFLMQVLEQPEELAMTVSVPLMFRPSPLCDRPLAASGQPRLSRHRGRPFQLAGVHSGPSGRDDRPPILFRWRLTAEPAGHRLPAARPDGSIYVQFGRPAAPVVLPRALSLSPPCPNSQSHSTWSRHSWDLFQHRADTMWRP